MNRAPMPIAAASLLALAACGQGGDNLSDDVPINNGAYDTVQPEIAGETVGVGRPGSTFAPAPLPDVVTGDIIQIAQQAGDFTTFVNAIESAGLTEMFEGPGPFTVFAPTDEAFAALPDGQLDEYMRPANREKLIALIEYHVLPAHVTTGDVALDVPSPATVQGATLMLETTTEGVVMAGGAKIVTADIQASNGVVHIIDEVITPPED